MYNEVENRFREEAFSRKFSKLNMILFICYILFSLLSFKIFESKIAVGSVIIYCLVFYLIIYVYLIQEIYYLLIKQLARLTLKLG